MLRQVSSRNHRSKGLRMKTALQISLLVAVTLWLLYQVKHSYDKKEYEESNSPLLIKDDGSRHEVFKFGRKVLPHREETDSRRAQIKEEENEDVEDMEQEIKREENEDEEKSGSGDDMIDELDQEKDVDAVELGEEVSEREEKDVEVDDSGLFEEEEHKEGSHEAREKSFQGDNVASAVVHNAQAAEREEASHEAREKSFQDDNASSAVAHDSQVTEHRERSHESQEKSFRGDDASSAVGHDVQVTENVNESNNITGELPVELGLLPKLQTLDLSNNRFSGRVPESLSRLSSLRYLRLNNNSFSGAFPVSLSKIPQLSFLDLSFNNLSGTVPLFPARTFNIMGNPLICGSHSLQECSRTATPIALPFFLQSSQKRSKAQKLAIAMGTSLGGSSLLLLAISLFLWRRKKQKHQSILGIIEREEEEEVVIGLGNLRQFGLRELQVATDNFNPRNILGKGGFGNVYKGRLGDGTVVAVKRLKDAGGSGEAQFRTEVEMISLAMHRNLLRLIGFCAAGGERLLVYPFMPNGSVATRLRGKPPLDWNTRKRIALGAARGLLYLHEQCDPKIIHRDVKAANVLLDEFCEAVVGDFGLAKLLDHGDSHVTTAVRGTVGHIAPEYLSTGQSSDKTDVFGFGILLLELIAGQRTVEFGKGPNQKGIILDWVRKVHQEKKLDLLVDRDLGINYDRIEVGEMVQVALLCTQYLPSHRPKMSEVVRMLEGDGLADKWEASNKLLPPPLDIPMPYNGSDSHSPFLIQTGDDDDSNSGDDAVEEMELSGPR